MRLGRSKDWTLVRLGRWQTNRIAGALSPFRFHPLQFYRTGVLAPTLAPNGTLFFDKDQFGSMTEPAIGTTVNGDRRTLTINDIRAEFGVQNGLNFSEWRQAFVVALMSSFSSVRWIATIFCQPGVG